MDKFQQQTSAIFLRRWIENAVDRDDIAEAEAMSRRLDELTMLFLREDPPAPLTAIGGRA